LQHYGVKGQSWGIRNYQNEDGSLTSLGKKRYLVGQTEHYSSPKEAQNKKGSTWVPKNKNIKDWWTGDNYKKSSNLHRDFSKDYREESLLTRGLGYNDHYSGGSRSVPDQNLERQAQIYADRSAEEEELANQLDTLYENSPRQVVRKTIKKGKDTVKNLVEDSKKTVNNIGSWASSQIDKGKKFFKGLFH
jgi:hypothetical protein